MGQENTSDIVAAAMAEAGGDVELPDVTADDTPDDVESEVTPEPEDGGAGAVEPEPEVEEEPEPKPGKEPNAAVNDVVKLLSEHGLKGLALNDKLPTVRARKIVYNAIKKLVEKHGGELKMRDDAVAQIRSAAEAANRWNQLVINPELTVAELAKIHPSLWGPVAEKLKASGVNPAKPLPSEDDDPEPKADIKYKPEEGGGIGYTPEQWEKREAWMLRKATREAKAEVEKTLKPIRDREKNQQDFNARQNEYQRETQALIEDFGEEFNNENTMKEVLAVMKEKNWNEPKFLRRAANLVINKQRTLTRDQQEAEWRKKLKNAPSAAKKTPGTGGGGGLRKESSGGPQTTAEIVAEAFANAK